MQLALAHHGDQHVERLFRDAVDLLDVQQRAVAHGRHQRAVDEHVRVIPIDQHPGGIEVADQPGRCQFGVALDELEAEAQLVGNRTQQGALAGARRALEQHVTIGGQCRNDQLDFSFAADDAAQHPLDERSGVSHGSLVHQHAADVLARVHVGVTVVDVLQRSRGAEDGEPMAG